MARKYYSGWPVGLTEKLAIEPATAQLKLGPGLSLAIMIVFVFQFIFTKLVLSAKLNEMNIFFWISDSRYILT